MVESNKTWYVRGLKAGVPIGLGYLAVAFTLGIAARTGNQHHTRFIHIQHPQL